MNRAVLLKAYRIEVEAYRTARNAGDGAEAWRRLERSHILSQAVLGLHLDAHRRMLILALSQRDWREAAGQLWRLALAPLGSMTGRIPWGNTGRANVSAFVPMEVPEDLRPLLSDVSR